MIVNLISCAEIYEIQFGSFSTFFTIKFIEHEGLIVYTKDDYWLKLQRQVFSKKSGLGVHYAVMKS